MNWSESVDQALCFGWIDGIRRKIDDESYSTVLRRAGQRAIERGQYRKVRVLTEKGLMKPANRAFEKRRTKSAIYSYKNKPEKFPAEFEKRFQAINRRGNFSKNRRIITKN